MGSRGNSGVILSQCLSGFAQGLGGADSLGPAEVVAGLQQAARSAYASVVAPVEGTMLTAAREAAEAAASRAPATALEALRAAADAAQRSVDLSPSRLPLLRDAGVVDAGAEGLRVILEAALAAAEGRPLDPQTVPAPSRGALSAARAVLVESELGYCTEFLVRVVESDPARARAALATLGSSTIVVLEGERLRVHLHTPHPGLALEQALAFGALEAIKIENMERQHQAHVAAERAAPPALGPLSVVGVVAGAGWTALYRELGAIPVDGGPTMNPSVAELVAALRAAPPGPLALLPNNPNVVAAARHAAVASERAVEVLPSRSPAQGVSALLTLGHAESPEEVLGRMRAALARVRTVEIARATRAARLHGVAVEADAYLALLDGAAVASDPDPAMAAVVALRAANAERADLVTIYSGEDAGAALVDAVRRALLAAFPHLQVETVPAGQPHYPLVLTLE